MTILSSQVDRTKREAAALRRAGISMSVGLSVIMSLVSVAIASKNALAEHLWVGLCAAVPILLGVYFWKQIERVGPVVHAVALVALLCAALAFGI